MRNWKFAIPLAAFALVAVVGVGASLAQTETPVAPTTGDSTEAAATAEATTSTSEAVVTPEATDRPRSGMGLPMMPAGGMMMNGAMVDVINAGLDAVAQQTGMSKNDIIAAVHNGQTVADLVKAKNGDLQAVIDATVKAATDKITAAVTAGTLTQAQADKITTNLTQIVTNAVNGKFPMMTGGMGSFGGPMNGRGNGPFGWPNGPIGGRPGHGGFNPWFGQGNNGPWGGFGNRGGMNMGGAMGMMNPQEVLIAAITNATKLKPRDLMRELRQGKTLTDIITANGSTVDAVVSSAVAAETDFINGRVELGLISREDADTRIAGLKDRFTQILSRTMPGPRRGPNMNGNPMATPEATADATQAVSA
jgi:hypothetical protein